MAGVNLKEESVRILAGGGIVIGSVVRSCQDTPFLYTGALQARILRTGTPLPNPLAVDSMVLYRRQESQPAVNRSFLLV